MRHGAGVFGKLARPEAPHVLDALDGGAAHVGGKLLIAKDGQSLLERELEPIAAGDAVARPVVEVFVPDDGLDALEIEIGGRLFVGQDVGCIEDVERLVFHGTHVKIVNGDNIVEVQVIFELVCWKKDERWVV